TVLMETSRRMKSRRSRLLLASSLALALAASAGCGSNATAPAPTGPPVSGDVILHATLTDEMGNVTGQRSITDATGVPVRVVSGANVVASGSTVAGHFQIAHVPAGSYVVRAVGPAVFDSEPVVVAGDPVVLSRTLEL